MAEVYSLDQFIQDLRAITNQTDDEHKIIGQVEPLAKRFAVDKSWLTEKHRGTDPEQGFGVHLLHEEPDHSLAVFAVSWMPGRGAPPHDHGTWAVVAGVEGVERNTIYKRLDDRSRPDYAELEIKHDSSIDSGELISMKSGGIHSVVNESDGLTISLHIYGRHLNYTGRSQYSLDTNEKKDFVVSVE